MTDIAKKGTGDGDAPASDASARVAPPEPARNGRRRGDQHLDNGNGTGEETPSGHQDEADPVSPAEQMRADFDESFEVVSANRYLLHNRTPYLVRLLHDDPHYGEILLPPFAERIIKGSRLRPFEQQIRRHRQRHELYVCEHEEEVSQVDKLIWLVWLSATVLFGIVVYDVVSRGTLHRPEFYIAAVVTVAIVLAVLTAAGIAEVRRKKAAADVATEAGDVAYGVGGSYTNGNETARTARHAGVLLFVILVGAVIPALAIIFATDTKTFLEMRNGLAAVDDTESRLVGRLIQITYTIILSLFPALLFFQFDRQRAGTLRAEWVKNLFRMDGRFRTLADVHAVHGDGMYDASGNSEDSVKLLGGKHSPIVIATILIMLGWTILVIRTDSYDFDRTNAAAQQVELANDAAEQADEAVVAVEQAVADGDVDAAQEALGAAESAADTAQDAEERTAEVAQVSNPDAGVEDAEPDQAPPPTTPRESSDLETIAEQTRVLANDANQSADAAAADETAVAPRSFFQVLAPNPSAAGMAFLGAYFFAVYLLMRNYFRGDLRPKVYNQITARLVTVVVVAYLISALFIDSKYVWALAFLAGVMPTEVVDTVFKKGVGGQLRKLSSERFTPQRPLEHIDGIDIYDSSRLESEGIPDVSALANSNLAALMFNTRLPIGRLVDWSDQAVLMVAVSKGTNELDPRIERLRERGIRTGTDLLDAVEGKARDDDAIRAVRECLVPSDDTADGPAVDNDADLDDLCESIRRQPIMPEILQWRSSPLADVDRSWIPLPEIGEPTPLSETYRGPLPQPPDGATPRPEAASATA